MLDFLRNWVSVSKSELIFRFDIVRNNVQIYKCRLLFCKFKF